MTQRIDTTALPRVKALCDEAGVPPEKVSWANVPRRSWVQFEEQFHKMTQEEIDNFREWTRNTGEIEVVRWGEYDKDDGETGYYPEKFAIGYDDIEVLYDGD